MQEPTTTLQSFCASFPIPSPSPRPSTASYHVRRSSLLARSLAHHLDWPPCRILLSTSVSDLSSQSVHVRRLVSTLTPCPTKSPQLCHCRKNIIHILRSLLLLTGPPGRSIARPPTNDGHDARECITTFPSIPIPIPIPNPTLPTVDSGP
jgi:hypothetical protein